MGISITISKLVNHISIKLWMCNSLSQERLKIAIILTYKLKGSVIKFVECVSKFVEYISLLKYMYLFS